MLLIHRIKDELNKEPCYVSGLATKLDVPYEKVDEEVRFLFDGGFIARSEKKPYSYEARKRTTDWHWANMPRLEEHSVICVCDQAGPCFSNYWVYNGNRATAEALFDDHIKAQKWAENMSDPAFNAHPAALR